MPDGLDHGRLTADTWQRVCAVLDRMHDTTPELRDTTLKAACREHGLSVDDVKPFLDAADESACKWCDFGNACGPNALVETIEHMVLNDLGVPKEQMKLEKWG